MMIKSKHKHEPCPTCKGKVIGRTDKRFCSIKCKNEHHRVARIFFKSRFYELQKRLQRNIIILEGAMGQDENCMIIHRNALFKYGFDLSANTNCYKYRKKQIFEIENYCYTIDRGGNVSVTRNKSLSQFMPVFFRRWNIDFPNGLIVDGNCNDSSA